MNTVAGVLYHLAKRGAAHHYLQIDVIPSDSASTVADRDLGQTFERTNCIHKQRITFDLRQDDTDPSSDLERELYDIMFVRCTRGVDIAHLERVYRFAAEHLTERGVVLFDWCNPASSDDAKAAGDGWQLVSRIRCKESAFACVLANVEHGIAVLAPRKPSRMFAKRHLPQYDDYDYLETNRGLLLNLMDFSKFLTLWDYI